MTKILVLHLRGTTGFDRYHRDFHKNNCTSRKCPMCNKFYKQNGLTKVSAHIEYNGAAWLISTCSSCNSSKSTIPFEVDSRKMTYITNDLGKYRRRELGMI